MDRYEEALERAKKGLPIDEVFPELKESEDEKIRKELLEEIEFIIPHDDETDSEGLILLSYYARIDRYKSYLEKQKEQKPIFKKGDKVIWDDEEFNILDVNETEYNVGGYRVPFSRQNELHPIWQKSAEWSEEDKTHLCWIIECFDSWKYQVPEFADQYQSAIDWLKSLRPDSYKNCNSPSIHPRNPYLPGTSLHPVPLVGDGGI